MRAGARLDALDGLLRAPVDHFHVIAAHDAHQQMLAVGRHRDAGRRRANRHGPFHRLRGQVDGADLVAALLRNESHGAVGREGHMAGQFWQWNALGQGQVLAVVAVQVDAVQAQRVRDEPFLVRRKADLVRVEDIADAALDLARHGVEENQLIADGTGDDQRLAVRRFHQVMRFLADGKGGQGSIGFLVQQLHRSITGIEHHHHFGLRRRYCGNQAQRGKNKAA